MPQHPDLVSLLSGAARHNPGGRVRFFQMGEEVESLSYGELHQEAGRVASGLRSHAGLQTGDRVALVLPTTADGLRGLFGIMAAGGVPVPLPPPLPFTSPERTAQRIRGAMARSKIRIILGPADLDEYVTDISKALGLEVKAHSISALRQESPTWQPLEPSSLALIQYTSGSTTAPKGVVLSHRSVLTNIRAIRSALQIGPRDLGAFWLPLFHDMGLVGLLTGMYGGSDMLLMSPEDFVMEPAHWLSLFGRYRASISPAPNLAYLHCVRRVPPDVVKTLDLSTWRSAMLGAEAVDPSVIRRFIEHFAPAGFRPEAVMPVYGMAEATLAVTFPPYGRGLRTITVSRQQLGKGVVEAMPPGHPDAKELPSVGVPVNDMELRLLGEDGRPTEPGRVGEVHIRGGSVTSGYDFNEEASRAAFRDGWLATGDLAFLQEGELYVVGRLKEVIIVGGQNYYATDVEIIANQVKGVGTRGVLAFGEQIDGTERLVILAETKEADPQLRKQLVSALRNEISSTLGISPGDVMLVGRGELPRTSSGKLERHKARALYAQLRDQPVVKPEAGS